MEKKKNYPGYTPARAAANKRYEAQTIERISVFVPRGKKGRIKAAADRAGESVNSYINNAVDERMRKEDEADV